MTQRWVCRMWTKKADGWRSDFERCGTKEEAIERGEIHKRYITHDDLEREYEVYEKGNEYNYMISRISKLKK